VVAVMNLVFEDAHCQFVQIEKLSDKQCQPVSQLKFVTDAWLQVLQICACAPCADAVQEVEVSELEVGFT